jgi:hypothetical protein
MKQTHIHEDTEVYIIPWYLHGDQIHLQSYVLLNSIFEASKMQRVREAKQTLHCIMYDRYSTCAHVTILRTPVTLLLCGSLRRSTVFPKSHHWSIFEASLSHSRFVVLTAVLSVSYLITIYHSMYSSTSEVLNLQINPIQEFNNYFF